MPKLMSEKQLFHIFYPKLTSEQAFFHILSNENHAVFQLKLNQFFDNIIAYYDNLPSGQAREEFLQSLIHWDGAQSYPWLWQLVYDYPHDKMIKLLITTPLFFRTPWPMGRQSNPVYLNHLAATYGTIRTSYLAKISEVLPRNIPAVLLFLIAGYAMPPLEIKKNEIVVRNHLHKQWHQEKKTDYFLSLLALILLGILWLALILLALSNLMILELIVSGALAYTLLCLGGIGFLFSTVVAGAGIFGALLSIGIRFKQSVFDPYTEFQNGLKFNQTLCISTLIGLALLSPLVLIIGILALCTPVGYTASVVTMTIASVITIPASVVGLGFFKSGYEKLNRENIAFDTIIRNCAQKTVPMLANTTSP